MVHLLNTIDTVKIAVMLLPYYYQRKKNLSLLYKVTLAIVETIKAPHCESKKPHRKGKGFLK